jgi:transposase
MQLQLPIFPVTTKMLNDTWGVFEKDDMVYYLHNGMPVYIHAKDDLNNFRFITANLIHVHACSPSQLSKVFGVNKINFERYVKRLKEGGTEAFFNAEDNRGKCYKMLEDKLKKAQELLDKGYSQLKTAKEIGVSESAIRYHLRAGNLKKKAIISSDNQELSSPSQRNTEDYLASENLGIATTRTDERMQAYRKEIKNTPIRFEASESVAYGGVLFLLPFLLSTGLLSYQKHYQALEPGYYDLDTTILSLAFMYLCRIKNPEQLKHVSPGEFGKLLGLDRIAEARTLREKINEIVEQKKSTEWNQTLAHQWVKDEENNIFYVDGHVKVYSGYAANLGKKHVSRLKLCLPGMMEFWINNSQGMPYFVVTGEVNEKLQEMLKTQIIKDLKEKISIPVSKEDLAADPDLPIFTLVFDREGYSPEYFEELWQERIAIITYRKNVKDLWAETDFTSQTIEIDGNNTTMELAEKEIELNGVTLREIRKKTETGHQTSIITTNKKLSLVLIAIHMFSRWAQENFFKYLIQEYDLDRIVHYIVNKIDDEVKVVNPIYSKLTNSLKKVREKISRRQAILYQLIHQNISQDADKTEINFKKQAILREEIKQLETEVTELITQRKQQKYKIEIKEMDAKIRYSKIDIESKHFQNIIKMICYRAETNFAMLLAVDYKQRVNQMRALAKSLIFSNVNIIPNEHDKLLIVELYSLATPRDNLAAKQICELLNETETIFPGTDLKLFYKIAT